MNCELFFYDNTSNKGTLDAVVTRDMEKQYVKWQRQDKYKQNTQRSRIFFAFESDDQGLVDNLKPVCKHYHRAFQVKERKSLVISKQLKGRHYSLCIEFNVNVHCLQCSNSDFVSTRGGVFYYPDLCCVA